MQHYSKTNSYLCIKIECVLAWTLSTDHCLSSALPVKRFLLSSSNCRHSYHHFKCIPRNNCLYTMFGLPTVSCTTCFVEDAPNVWATKTMTGNNQALNTITLWYCPANNHAMTLGEVASVIERDIGIRVGSIAARGVSVPRSELGNYMAADLLRG